jgi:hypothetical protein
VAWSMVATKKFEKIAVGETKFPTRHLSGDFSKEKINLL